MLAAIRVDDKARLELRGGCRDEIIALGDGEEARESSRFRVLAQPLRREPTNWLAIWREGHGFDQLQLGRGFRIAWRGLAQQPDRARPVRGAAHAAGDEGAEDGRRGR